MLPQNINNPRTIHINPNFKGQQQPPYELVPSTINTGPPAIRPLIPANAHINPLFLEQKKRPTIHMNPRFLLKLQEQKSVAPTIIPTPKVEQIDIGMHELPPTVPGSMLVHGSAVSNTIPKDARKIICKSKNRLIREPVLPAKSLIVKEPTKQAPQPIIVVTKSKLIRKSATQINTTSANQVMKVNTDVSGSKVIKTKYKLDNRVIKKKALFPTSVTRIRRKSFVGRFALLRRNSTSLSQSSLSSAWSKCNTTKKSQNIQSMNKKLQLLNINGLLYKSTRNSLKLKDLTNTNIATSPTKKSTNAQDTKPSPGLTIFVRGTKYVMDPQKFKLTRVSTSIEKGNTSSSSSSNSGRCSRIDIGGFTYVSAPATRNILIRTRNHLARAYVNNAKQKSLQLLTKRLVKSNIPCPIYQRVGKCAAFERGKCLKVHNKQQVAICPKYVVCYVYSLVKCLYIYIFILGFFEANVLM